MAQEEDVLGKAYDSRLMRRLPSPTSVLIDGRSQSLLISISEIWIDVLGPFLQKLRLSLLVKTPALSSPF